MGIRLDDNGNTNGPLRPKRPIQIPITPSYPQHTRSRTAIAQPLRSHDSFATARRNRHQNHRHNNEHDLRRPRQRSHTHPPKTKTTTPGTIQAEIRLVGDVTVFGTVELSSCREEIFV